MKAMILKELSSLDQHAEPLVPATLPDPEPGDHDLLVRISVCGVCHTELDEIEGRTPPPQLPMIPGHQVVGTVERCGAEVHRFKRGDRVGIAWIFSACGSCDYCVRGEENLCSEFKATGRDAHGGYAEFMTVQQDFAVAIPETFSDAQAAPLLCAGAIGYRSLRLAGISDGETLGLTGFGASAHLVLKLVNMQYPASQVFVFARSKQEQAFARELGAAWSGDTADTPPDMPRAIIDTTPVWKPIVSSLRHLAPGGRLIINAIRKEDTDKKELLDLQYEHHLWQEKEIKSVANVTRNDVQEFLSVAANGDIKPDIEEYPLVAANTALLELKQRKIRGAKVLTIGT